MKRLLPMRMLLIALAVVATPAIAATDIVMHRDPGCSCCEAWAAQVAKQFGRAVKIIDTDNRRSIQKAAGMPEGLASCHTALIGGMAFEGHVPIADMKRVLAERPAGMKGLAVPGMPIGSPGMEVAGRSADRFDVIAFGGGTAAVFVRH